MAPTAAPIDISIRLANLIFPIAPRLNAWGFKNAAIATNTAAKPTRLWKPATNSGIAVIGILNAIKAPIAPPTTRNKKTYINVVEKLPENKVVNEKNSGIIIEAEIASYNNKKNSIVEEKSIEKEVEVETNDQITETKKKDQITIDDIIENIKEEGFENTAIKFSSSPTAQLGGNLGWVSESKFSKVLVKSIKETKIGSITEPIPISEGILILKVGDKRAEETKMDLDKEMEKLIEIEKNKQLNNFSTNYYNQVKSSIKIKYFND